MIKQDLDGIPGVPLKKQERKDYEEDRKYFGGYLYFSRNSYRSSFCCKPNYIVAKFINRTVHHGLSNIRGWAL